MKFTTAKFIEIVISPQGETSIETKGFNGPECQQASAPFVKALGTTSHERPTAEFYAAATEEIEQEKA